MKRRTKQKIAGSVLFLVRLPAIAISNTVKAGWEAPQRWYNFLVKGKPFWAYLKRK